MDVRDIFKQKIKIQLKRIFQSGKTKGKLLTLIFVFSPCNNFSSNQC